MKQQKMLQRNSLRTKHVTGFTGRLEQNIKFFSHAYYNHTKYVMRFDEMIYSSFE